MQLLNESTKNVEGNSKQGVEIQSLEQDNLHMKVYNDSLVADKRDLRT